MFEKFKENFSRPKGLMGSVAGKIMAFENQEINKWTIEHLQVHPNDHVLEVGYGPGYSIECLTKEYSHIQVDGIDPSQQMKEQAEHRLKDEVEEGRVSFFVGPIETAELKANSYQKVLSVNNYTIWDDPLKGLTNLYQSMAPGGKIAITMQPREEDACADKTRMFGRKIEEDLRQCGFQDIETRFRKVRPELTVCVTAVKPLTY